MPEDYEALPAGSTFFRPPSESDLDTIHAIEAASYPEDEAATREKLDFRIRNAPSVFLVATTSGGGGGAAGGAPQPGETIGYVCGTLSAATELTHESMSTHDPAGALLCVHSVVVAAPHRRRGVATRLLKAYLGYVAATTPQLREVRLICKQEMVPLYEGVGFKLVGPSPVEHGKDPWLEMKHALGDGSD